MSRTSDVINLIRDLIKNIGTDVYKYAHPPGLEGTERIVLNSIPIAQERAGTLKQNNDIININLFIPKINGVPNARRIEILDESIQNTIESFDGTTSRVKYSYLDAQPSQTFNESDKETLTNIRIEITYT